MAPPRVAARRVQRVRPSLTFCFVKRGLGPKYSNFRIFIYTVNKAAEAKRNRLKNRLKTECRADVRKIDWIICDRNRVERGGGLRKLIRVRSANKISEEKLCVVVNSSVG